jgi:hypothetical protein
MAKSKKEFSIRLAPALHRRLARAAKGSGWTVNAEITKRLEASFIAADVATFTDAALLSLDDAMRQHLDKLFGSKQEKETNV